MTWPTVAVVTTNTDADTDSPLVARADLLDLEQKFNQVIAHVTVFMRTLLDDMDGPTALTTLGFSAFVKTLVDDVDDVTFLGTLGFSAFGRSLRGVADAAAHRAIATPFSAGTRMLFQQTAAPTGWTKETSATYNDAALRIQTGTVATGGADAFSTHFGTAKSTAGHVLLLAEIPSHSHAHGFSASFTGAFGNITGPNIQTHTFSGTGTSVPLTDTRGSNLAHSHVLNNFNIKFADCIIAAKD